MTKSRYLISLYLLALLLFLFDLGNFLSPLRTPLDRMIVPTLDSITRAKQSIFFFTKALSNYRNLLQLQSQVDSLTLEKTNLSYKLNLLDQENSKLRDQLGSPLSYSYKLIPAKVISFDRYINIDAGSRNIVSPGMYATSGVNFIGKAIKTTNSRALIMTYLDSEMKIPVKTNRGVKGILTGNNNKTVMVTNILQKDPLFLNDEISTSGESDFPPDLLIGKINHIDADDASAYKTGIVTPSVDILNLQNVFLINDL